MPSHWALGEGKGHALFLSTSYVYVICSSDPCSIIAILQIKKLRLELVK